MRGPEQRSGPIAQLTDALRGRGNDECVRREGALEIVRHHDGVRDRDARQVPGVLAPRGDLVRPGGVAGPEDDGPSPVAGQDRRERRAPGPGLEDRYVDGDLRCPRRGSLPRRIRAMFARCRTVTIAPAMRMNPSTAQWNERYPANTKTM